MSLEFISRFDDLTESLGGNLPDISLSSNSGLEIIALTVRVLKFLHQKYWCNHP